MGGFSFVRAFRPEVQQAPATDGESRPVWARIPSPERAACAVRAQRWLRTTSHRVIRSHSVAPLPGVSFVDRSYPACYLSTLFRHWSTSRGSFGPREDDCAYADIPLHAHIDRRRLRGAPGVGRRPAARHGPLLLRPESGLPAEPGRQGDRRRERDLRQPPRGGGDSLHCPPLRRRARPLPARTAGARADRGPRPGPVRPPPRPASRAAPPPVGVPLRRSARVRLPPERPALCPRPRHSCRRDARNRRAAVAAAADAGRHPAGVAAQRGKGAARPRPGGEQARRRHRVRGAPGRSHAGSAQRSDQLRALGRRPLHRSRRRRRRHRSRPPQQRGSREPGPVGGRRGVRDLLPAQRAAAHRAELLLWRVAGIAADVQRPRSVPRPRRGAGHRRDAIRDTRHGRDQVRGEVLRRAAVRQRSRADRLRADRRAAVALPEPVERPAAVIHHPGAVPAARPRNPPGAGGAARRRRS